MQSGSGMTSSLHSRTINLNRRAWSGAADPGLRGTIANTTTLSRVADLSIDANIANWQ